MNESLKAIKRVVQKRKGSGASKQSIIEYLDHLITGPWKLNPEMISEIQKIKNKEIA